MKLIRSLVLMVSLAYSFSASAYVLNTTTKIVSDVGSGKEWLQWTETRGMSISDALAIYEADGWKVASNKDMAHLFEDFFPDTSWDLNENTVQSWDGFVGDGIDSSKIFGDLFGWTSWNNSVAVATGDTYNNHNEFYMTIALFGEDFDLDNYFNMTYINSESVFYSHINHSWIPNYESTYMDHDYFSVTYSNRSVGVALTRDIVNVTEPATLSMIVLAIIGLSAARRKMQM